MNGGEEGMARPRRYETVPTMADRRRAIEELTEAPELDGDVSARRALYMAMTVCLGGVLGLVVYSYLVWRTTVR